jgi:hypothetical protein
MLNIYYANRQALVPFRLFTTAGLPVTGKVLGDLTVTVLKADGTTAAVTPDAFAAVVAGAFNNQGLYTITLPVTATNVPGPLTIAINDGTNVAITVIGIVSALAADAIANVWAAS